MLVKAQDVAYCQLVRQFGTTAEIVSGVRYQGNLFVQGNSYPHQQRQTAITEMRRSFLDPEPAIACLLVEETDRVTIWYEDRYIIKVVEGSDDIVQHCNLAELVELLRKPGGIEIKNRSQSFRLPHLRCFVGREAVTWISKKLEISREDTVKLGQRLVDEKWLKPITAERQSFQDNDCLYRFKLDD